MNRDWIPGLMFGCVIFPWLNPAPGATQQAELVKLHAADGASGDFFGWSLALNRKRALVGSIYDDDAGLASGSATLFEGRPDGSWFQAAKLTANDAAPNSQFGRSVALSGDRCLVGAWLADAVYIFERDVTGTWSQVAKLELPPGSPEHGFGQAVALDGDRALVSTTGNDQVGRARVYERDALGAWLEVALIVDPSPTTSNCFACTLSLLGDQALFSAVGDSQLGLNSGAAYVFEKDSQGVWNPTAKLVASDAHQFDFFGQGALAKDRALVGSRGHDGVAFNIGAAYVFEPNSSGVWMQVAQLIASDASDGDFFGSAVALDGDRALIGAYGVNDQGPDSGAGYAFERAPGGNWVQTAKLVPKDAAAGDELGVFAVALSDDIALIPALRDDDLGDNSGSAYLYDLEPLSSDHTRLSLAAGGTQALELDAGHFHAGELYLVLGSASGSTPGIPLDGNLLLPLVLDDYLLLTLNNPNQPPLSNSLATLNAFGHASAAVTLPTSLNPALSGLTLHHACLCFSTPGPLLTFASNPATLTLTP